MSNFVTYSKLGQNGRLGNQLFQISATLAYANKHKKPSVFPEWSYNKYMFHPLNTGKLEGCQVYNEPEFSYNEIPYIEGNLDLHGYFQSEKYFGNMPLNYSWFDLSDHYYKSIESKIGLLNPDKKRLCAIHIRRGDYLNPQTMAYHGVLDEEYYYRAIHCLYHMENITKVRFLIFSDDPEWCKDNLDLDGLDCSVIEGNEDIIDLWLMAQCHDFIIANSSFSWWGSYLSEYKHKRIIAPESWFNEAPLSTKDLYTNRMIVL